MFPLVGTIVMVSPVARLTLGAKIEEQFLKLQGIFRDVSGLIKLCILVTRKCHSYIAIDCSSYLIELRVLLRDQLCYKVASDEELEISLWTT